MSGTVLLVLTLLVLVAGFLARRRIRRAARDTSGIVSDDLLRRILDEKALQSLDDEPLDEDAIRRAEDEFWEEEQWTDADDWRG